MVVQLLHSFLQLRFVRFGGNNQPPQVADDARALLEGLAASLLESFVARQELREVSVIDLELLLRLHERVCIEHPLDVARRHAGIGIRYFCAPPFATLRPC